jgi:hypothetical protein
MVHVITNIFIVSLVNRDNMTFLCLFNSINKSCAVVIDLSPGKAESRGRQGGGKLRPPPNQLSLGRASLKPQSQEGLFWPLLTKTDQDRVVS